MDKAELAVHEAMELWGYRAGNLLSPREKRAEVALQLCMILMRQDEDSPLFAAGEVASEAMERFPD